MFIERRASNNWLKTNHFNQQLLRATQDVIKIITFRSGQIVPIIPVLFSSNFAYQLFAHEALRNQIPAQRNVCCFLFHLSLQLRSANTQNGLLFTFAGGYRIDLAIVIKHKTDKYFYHFFDYHFLRLFVRCSYQLTQANDNNKTRKHYCDKQKRSANQKISIIIFTLRDMRFFKCRETMKYSSDG